MMSSVFETPAMFGVAYDTHPVEPTGKRVATALRTRRIAGIVAIQANIAAASQEPPVRQIDEELTGAFRLNDDPPATSEGMRAHKLRTIYRGLQGVIDIHNNATMRTTYGLLGPESQPVTLGMAALLNLRDIVVIDWPGYEYFGCNPNLLVAEGRNDNPDYSAEWWHERLGALTQADPISAPPSNDFKFYKRLPDVTGEQARNSGLSAFEWEASFDSPLPTSVVARLGYPNDAEIYALSWSSSSRVGYADSDHDYFGELVSKMPSPYADI